MREWCKKALASWIAVLFVLGIVNQLLDNSKWLRTGFYNIVGLKENNNEIH